MAHWRDSARTVRFFVIDYRAAFPLLLLLVHIRMWTFLAAIAGTVFFAIIEHYGYTVNVFFRRVRSFIAGPHKIAQPWWRM